MKIIFLILLFTSTTFAADQYCAESSTFSINTPIDNTFSAESQTFSIDFTKPYVYFAESATFELTGIEEIPEPFAAYYLAFIIYYLRKKRIIIKT